MERGKNQICQIERSNGLFQTKFWISTNAELQVDSQIEIISNFQLIKCMNICKCENNNNNI